MTNSPMRHNRFGTIFLLTRVLACIRNSAFVRARDSSISPLGANLFGHSCKACHIDARSLTFLNLLASSYIVTFLLFVLTSSNHFVHPGCCVGGGCSAACGRAAGRAAGHARGSSGRPQEGQGESTVGVRVGAEVRVRIGIMIGLEFSHGRGLNHDDCSSCFTN